MISSSSEDLSRMGEKKSATLWSINRVRGLGEQQRLLVEDVARTHRCA